MAIILICQKLYNGFSFALKGIQQHFGKYTHFPTYPGRLPTPIDFKLTRYANMETEPVNAQKIRISLDKLENRYVSQNVCVFL